MGVGKGMSKGKWERAGKGGTRGERRHESCGNCYSRYLFIKIGASLSFCCGRSFIPSEGAWHSSLLPLGKERQGKVAQKGPFASSKAS